MVSKKDDRISFLVLKNLFGKLLNISRKRKKILLFAADIVFASMAYIVAIFLSFQKIAISSSVFSLSALIASVVVISSLFLFLGVYKNITRFVGAATLGQIVLGISITTGLLYIFHFGLNQALPINVLVIYWVFLLLFLLGFRGSLRMLVSRWSKHPHAQNVIIYGAGAAGQQLLATLKNNKEYHAIAFVDDDPELWFLHIGGLHVHKPTDLENLVSKHEIKKLLLAIPSATRRRKREILNGFGELNVTVQTVPSMSDIADGRFSISNFQNLDIMDILGRAPVDPIPSLFDRKIRNKAVFVSGAGGTIGSEICRQIIELEPKRIILFEISEFALYKIEHDLIKIKNEKDLDVDIVPILGSVLKRKKVASVFAKYQIETVYHAAAYKHVPLVQSNIVEGVENNVMGTLALAEEANRKGVNDFILISTDKAVRPTNIMGASKRLAEMILQALADQGATTRFSMVRFGNVLGSSGSVVPRFEEQIKYGGPVTVTHPDILRYFMTVPEAAQLVLQAGAMAKGGDVFLLDMGNPIKIVDLAKKMIQLSGQTIRNNENPDGDVEIIYVGLRDGEKLFEELLIGGDEMATQHPRIMRAREEFKPWRELKSLLEQIEKSCTNLDDKRVYELLLREPLVGFTKNVMQVPP